MNGHPCDVFFFFFGGGGADKTVSHPWVGALLEPALLPLLGQPLKLLPDLLGGPGPGHHVPLRLKPLLPVHVIDGSLGRIIQDCEDKYDQLTLIPLGYFEDLSPLRGGGGGLFWPPPPQISATNRPIDSKIGTVVKQVK